MSTNSIKEQVFGQLKASKEYRQAFIEESIRSRLTAQINALRNEREWDYRTFAERIGKKRSWAYRLEDPNVATPTVPTLLEVAEAFDIGLDVRFCRFSELLGDVTSLNQESFLVPSFEAEVEAGAFFHQPKRKRKTTRKSKLALIPKRKPRKSLGRAQITGNELAPARYGT